MKAKSLIFIGLLGMLLTTEIFAAPSIQEQRNRLVNECKTYIGTPYLYGGLSKDGIDCSGFVYTTVRDATSIQLPRTAKAIYSFVRIIPDDKLQKGDLVFFQTTLSSKISHVGVYIGKDQFIHAVSDGPNTGVIVSSLKENYWKSKYAGGGTFFPQKDEPENKKPEYKKSEYKKPEQIKNSDYDDKKYKEDDDDSTRKNTKEKREEKMNEIMEERERMKREREEKLNKIKNR